MRFRDQDIFPNRSIKIDQVRVGCTSDARWRSVLTAVDGGDAGPINCLTVHELERARFESEAIRLGGR